MLNRSVVKFTLRLKKPHAVKANRLEVYPYTGGPRRNVLDFGRVFLMLKCTDITQNTYVQS